jgi:hypothetical protein
MATYNVHVSTLHYRASLIRINYGKKLNNAVSYRIDYYANSLSSAAELRRQGHECRNAPSNDDVDDLQGTYFAKLAPSWNAECAVELLVYFKPSGGPINL